MSTGAAAANRPTSFDLHIKPLFRPDPDVDHMLNQVGMDLTSYDVVKDYADAILERLTATDNTMMPPAADGGPWPNEWIDLFRRWIFENYPT